MFEFGVTISNVTFFFFFFFFFFFYTFSPVISAVTVEKNILFFGIPIEGNPQYKYVGRKHLKTFTYRICNTAVYFIEFSSGLNIAHPYFPLFIPPSLAYGRMRRQFQVRGVCFNVM